ncbi:diguanylate cyclase [[Clostridium] symbiosum]|uniref:diguanylate cyclase domain-containing protein n=1 Tax=Clostridium symbiosum TaxID=1512 RepID=UPI001D08070D|nr:diguanylate cyclase [[Clostridium] symbiosum]MCB6608093.1 diguanylate cyclase [[Clostridium] symbiosum]MCB6931067.1 diguanylate cyclase [[Clostridium] symbiosum]
MKNNTDMAGAADGGIFNCRYDKFFTLISADESLFRFLGYSREEFAKQFDNHVLDAIYEGDREILLQEADRQFAANKVFRYENRLVVKGGRIRWVWVSAELVEDAGGGQLLHCIFHDISRERRAQEQLEINEKRYDIILSHIQDIIFDLDCTTYSIYYSPNFKKKFGYEIPSQGFPDSMFSTDIIYDEDKPVLRENFQSLLKGETDMECEYRIKSRDGSYIWVDVHAAALRDAEGRLAKILGIISDIDQRKREIIKAQKEATSDPLTGLLNRRECIAQIEEYMNRCHNPAAFMLIDVDNFKSINDTYGHLYGDSVLNEFANSLRTIFRRDDLIARIGGDEFVVFMTNVETGSIIEDKVKRIEAVSRNFTVKEGAAKIGCSIGISFYPGHGSDFRSLFAKADAAMYHVKKQGKGWYCIYGEDMAKAETGDSDTPSRVMKKSFHDHIIEHVFRIFLENPDTGTAIAILMNLIGRVFYADQIFIYERGAGRKLVNTYRWNREHIPGGTERCDNGTGLDIDGLPLKEDITVYLNTDQIEEPTLRQWFTDHGAMAAITCCMKESEEVSTVIIYEDCHGTRVGSGEEQYTLLMVSRIIHLFLLKENNAIRLQKQENIAERTLLEKEIAHQEMIYRTALKETHINVWEYDVKTHTLRLTESAEEHHGFRILGNVPESLISGGYVHHRSRRELFDMYQKLENGHHHVQADILTRSADKSFWWWERIHYTMLFTPEGEPSCAVAIGEDITQQKRAEKTYQQELQLRMAFDSRMLASFRCNLDKNCVEYVEAHSHKNYPPGMTYERLMEIHNKTMVNEEDMERLKVLMNREALQQAYQNGTTSINFEYRRKDENGSLSWVNATGQLLRDVESGDLYIYGTLEDINEKKNLELALKRRADYDMLTGVYNRDTAIQMIGDALAKAHKKNNSFSLLIFDVDGFTNLVRSSGYIAADSILKELASQLKIRFTSEKIIGRFYGDEFVVFFYNSPKPDLIWRGTEEVIKAMALPYMFPEIRKPVNVFCGMVFDNHNGTEFEAMYRKARAALDSAKTSEAGNIFVYNENRNGEGGNKSARILPPESVNGAGYDSESEGILLKCMFSLVSTADLRPPLEHTLQELADYYDGDRAYIIELEGGRGGIREVYEWKKDELISITNTAERLFKAEKMKRSEEDFRQLRYVEDVGRLKENHPELFPILKNLGIFSCIFGILNEGDNPIGYIGIDNPRRHTDNTSILMAIRYFLSNELIKRRLQEKQEFLSYHDELTGVLNRNSYKEYRMNLREEGLISLGVVSVDINGLKEINQKNGNAYGDGMIRIIAHIMETEYPAARVYRFSGDEFLLICENISQDSFNMRLNRMKGRLQEICSVSVGSAWADIDINLDFLISGADERRLIAKRAYYDEQQYSTVRRSAGALKTLLEEIAQNHFMVYLQPKINAKTNQLCGAEALVRYRDKKYGVVSPGKFVPYLETVGLIHYIDFFVFEEVCRLIKKWKECDLPQIPVSLNFSRATLLEENLIGKMEQIILRYGVDRSLVEIEITESLGEVARNTVAQIGNQIVQAGFRIILDDFGTKYSNLSFLSLLHFHNLKLDKSLVNHLLINRNARIIVKNIVALCRELNVEVLAEGVENQEQLDVLKELQCFLIQGYFYSKPLPFTEFEEQYLDG